MFCNGIRFGRTNGCLLYTSHLSCHIQVRNAVNEGDRQELVDFKEITNTVLKIIWWESTVVYEWSSKRSLIRHDRNLYLDVIIYVLAHCLSTIQVSPYAREDRSETIERQVIQAPR